MSSTIYGRPRQRLRGACALAVVLSLSAACQGGGSGSGGGTGDTTHSPQYAAFRDEAVALQRRGDPNGALKAAARALMSAPGAREPYEMVSQLYIELGDDAHAAEFFDRVATQHPLVAAARLYQGFHEFRLGRWDLALESYRRASELDPTNPEPYFRQGLIHQAQGSFDEALAALGKARELDSSSPVIAARLARLLRITGDYEQSKRIVNEALGRTPDSPDLKYARGQLLLHEGKLDEAEAALRGVLALQPRHREAHHDLGRLLQRLGRFDEARREATIARRLTDLNDARDRLIRQLPGGDPLVPLALAEIELTEDGFREALHWFQRAEQSGGPRSRIAAGRAEAYFGMGDLQRGEAELARLRAGDGRAALARAARALAAGSPADAVAWLDLAAERGPNERDFLRRVADGYAEAGNAARSTELLARADSAP